MKTQTKNRLLAFVSPMVLFAVVALMNYALNFNVWIYGIVLVLGMSAVVLGLLKQLTKQTSVKSLMTTILLAVVVLCLVLLPIPSFKEELIYRWLILSAVLFGSIGVGRLLFFLFNKGNNQEHLV